MASKVSYPWPRALAKPACLERLAITSPPVAGAGAPGSSCSFLPGKADARGDAVQVPVRELVAVGAELAGQGSLADPFAAGGSGLEDQARLAQQVAVRAGTGLAARWAAGAGDVLRG